MRVLSILQFGAFPVFIVDGTPSLLKSHARITRFFRSAGIELTSLPVAEEGVSVERNRAFSRCVKECVVRLFVDLYPCDHFEIVLQISFFFFGIKLLF